MLGWIPKKPDKKRFQAWTEALFWTSFRTAYTQSFFWPSSRCKMPYTHPSLRLWRHRTRRRVVRNQWGPAEGTFWPRKINRHRWIPRGDFWTSGNHMNQSIHFMGRFFVRQTRKRRDAPELNLFFPRGKIGFFRWLQLCLDNEEVYGYAILYKHLVICSFASTMQETIPQLEDSQYCNILLYS